MFSKANNTTIKRLVWVCILLFVFAGCNTTRYVPRESYLLQDVNIDVDNSSVSKDKLSMQLRQKENLRILGVMKFHLWLYNLSSKKKENGWFKRIGEPPVIYDQGLKQKSIQQMSQYLSNKGYYHAQVSDTVFIKKKKAKVRYMIKTGDPYKIQSVHYQINDKKVAEYIDNIRKKSLIREGNILDMDVLRDERSRITKMLQNDGFFNFADEYIHFIVDTGYYNNEARVEMIIEPYEFINPDSAVYHLQHRVNTYSIFIDEPGSVSADNVKSYSDTSIFNGFTFYHNERIPLKPRLFFESIELDPGALYQKRLEDKTYNNLYALRQFKYVNIQYQQEGDDGLHGRIFVPLQVKQNYSFDIEGTHTSGDLGIAGNINYQHRNLLGGAQILDITLRGATERMFTYRSKTEQDFNTIEYGGMVGITVPGMVFFNRSDFLSLYSMPFTSFSVSYNYQNRPNYTRTIINARFGYKWRTSAYRSHTVNLLDLNTIRIFSMDQAFIDGIKDLYIKSSFTDHIISAANYTYTYNNQSSVAKSHNHFFRFNFEASGNILWAVSNMLNREKITPVDDNLPDQSSYYKFFDTRFAQYVKADFDYRYAYRFDKYNWIATRFFSGVALPYGNFNVLPFEKRYYTGGANGIRAWHVRTLGPGSYSAPEDAYAPNQSSDIKLEGNIEYRYKLFWMIEGALFVDAGNVWAINRFDNREGALFEFNDFYQEIAIGTGTGIRLVTPYFIVRFDLGLKLRDPSLPVGERWIPQSRSFIPDDFNYSFGIGYPF